MLFVYKQYYYIKSNYLAFFPSQERLTQRKTNTKNLGPFKTQTSQEYIIIFNISYIVTLKSDT